MSFVVQLHICLNRVTQSEAEADVKWLKNTLFKGNDTKHSRVAAARARAG